MLGAHSLMTRLSAPAGQSCLGIEAAALGASESALPGTALAEALHTFTLDSSASRCFFCDNTTLTPLPAPDPVRLADPSGGPVLARSSTVLPCPAVPSGSLSGLHLPSFSTNFVSTAASTNLESTAALQDTMVSALGPVAAPCSCRLMLHKTLLWHHRLGHPSLPRLRGMHSRLLVSGLPRSLPHLLPLPAPPCLPCVEGRQSAAPHSSSFPPMTAPLQTLHVDVWSLAHVNGQDRERYFLLVVDDYACYTTFCPLCSKGEVPDDLIPWIRAVHLQLCERFREDLHVLRLHSDRGGEFSSDLLREFCRGEDILQTFTLLASPQKNGVAERRIGLVIEVARTSMIHATAPHFLWPFAVRFTTPPSRRVIPSQDVTFDESVPFYRRPPVDPLPPQGLALSGVSQVDLLPLAVPIKVVVESGAARGAVSGGAASGGAEPASAEPGGAEPEGAEPGGAESEGADSGGAEPEGAEPGGTEPEGAEPGGAEPDDVESGGAEPRGSAPAGGPAGASP
ncbi:unnamed protein product [Closterium sp. NIES-53]